MELVFILLSTSLSLLFPSTALGEMLKSFYFDEIPTVVNCATNQLIHIISVGYTPTCSACPFHSSSPNKEYYQGDNRLCSNEFNIRKECEGRQRCSINKDLVERPSQTECYNPTSINVKIKCFEVGKLVYSLCGVYSAVTVPANSHVAITTRPPRSRTHVSSCWCDIAPASTQHTNISYDLVLQTMYYFGLANFSISDSSYPYHQRNLPGSRKFYPFSPRVFTKMSGTRLALTESTPASDISNSSATLILRNGRWPVSLTCNSDSSSQTTAPSGSENPLSRGKDTTDKVRPSVSNVETPKRTDRILIPVVIALSLLVIVLIAGFVGYCVWKKRKAKRDAYRAVMYNNNRETTPRPSAPADISDPYYHELEEEQRENDYSEPLEPGEPLPYYASENRRLLTPLASPTDTDPYKISQLPASFPSPSASFSPRDDGYSTITDHPARNSNGSIDKITEISGDYARPYSTTGYPDYTERTTLEQIKYDDPVDVTHSTLNKTPVSMVPNELYGS